MRRGRAQRSMWRNSFSSKRRRRYRKCRDNTEYSPMTSASTMLWRLGFLFAKAPAVRMAAAGGDFWQGATRAQDGSQQLTDVFERRSYMARRGCRTRLLPTCGRLATRARSRQLTHAFERRNSQRGQRTVRDGCRARRLLWGTGNSRRGQGAGWQDQQEQCSALQ